MRSSAPAAAADLVISNWDGYMAPDAMDAFKAATGVAGEVVVHATNEEIMGKLVASGGKGYDVVFVSSPFAEVLNKLGLTEPIDHAKVPNLANLYPEATTLPYDPGNTFSVPYTWGTTGPLLSLRPGEDRADQLERSAGAVRRPQGQDHHAGDRPLAAGRRPAREGLFGQRDRSGQDGRGQGPADRGQEDLARL